MQIKTVVQFFLIISIVIILILFFYNYLGEKKTIEGSNYEKKFDIELKSTEKSINLLENLEYKTIDEDGNGYLLKAKYGETLIDRSGLLYEVNGQKPYTGDVFELHDDGGRKYTGSIKGGKRVKTWTYWYKNGLIMSEEVWKDGEQFCSYKNVLLRTLLRTVVQNEIKQFIQGKTFHILSV